MEVVEHKGSQEMLEDLVEDQKEAVQEDEV